MTELRYEFFYLCRKCGRKIPASFPDNVHSAKVVKTDKWREQYQEYEFECKERCENDTDEN
jgi:hypothetical protein